MNYILYEKPEIIKPLFRLYDYDVIIAWNYQLPSFCLRSFKHEIKIAWFHAAIYDFLPNAIDAKPEYYKQLQLKTWETADRIITISKISLQSLKDIFPELVFKTEIIYNGFYSSRMQQLSIKDSDISIHTECQNIIIGVGRLDRNKNFELLIRAVSQVIHSGINCFLIILGNGELLSELEDIAVQENIEDYVLFAGYQKNPYPYIKLSKVVCLTSFSEGWPTVIVEGMVLGKPFVTTPVAGASDELADKGRCGLVSDWNIEGYSNCLKKLLADQNLYEEMSINCMEKIKEYSIENAVIQFDTLIKKLNNAHISEYITDVEEHINIKKRISALLYFAMVFSFIDFKYPLITDAFRRYKNRSTLINCIKLFFHFSLFIINPFLIPLKFFIGFVRACFLGY